MGAGLAGAQTCAELRRCGFTGRITLVGDEPDPPYDRPPLSKGAVGEDTGDLGFDFDALEVDFRPDATAVGLAGASIEADQPLRVMVAEGQPVAADAVVVASGAAPIVPATWQLTDRVRVLRSRRDAIALHEMLSSGGVSSLLVVGGSWIGLEVGSLAAASGIDVTVVERAAWLLPQLPPEVGRRVHGWCGAAGIDVVLGLPVDGVGDRAVAPEVDGTPVWVEVGDSRMSADAALIALGVRPNTGWLQESGLPLVPGTGALRVDQWMTTADPRVFGVGDAVARWSPKYSKLLPGGHWQDAMDAPTVAAKSVLAALEPTAPRPDPYDAVPYFWSEMFGHMLQWTGYLSDYRAARLVVREADDSAGWTMCWLDDRDRLCALLACDRPRDAVAARKAQAAAENGAPWADVEALADPQRPLKSCLTAARGE